MIYHFGSILLRNIYVQSKKISSDLIIELKSFSDRFLELLSSENYDRLYMEYGFNTGMSKKIFLSKIDDLKNSYGIIKSFQYSHYSSISNKKKLSDFSLIYNLDFISNDSYKCEFKYYINKNSNEPYKDKIRLFRIDAMFSGRKDYYLNLM